MNKLAEAFEDPDGGTSMTRVIALMFAVVICYAIVLMARRDHLHDAGWPFCVLACVTLAAVPLQALFKALVEWFKSKPGQAIVTNLLSKVSTMPLGIVTTTTGVTTDPPVGGA